MSKYDFFFILSGNRTESEVTGTQDRIKSLLEAEGAQGVSFEAMGKQKLAYVIWQDRFGYLFNCVFDLEKTKVAAFKEKLKQQPEIIRYLISALKHGQVSGKYTIKTVVSPEERAYPTRDRRPVFASSSAVKEEQPKPQELSSEELDKKLEEILQEKPAI